MSDPQNPPTPTWEYAHLGPKPGGKAARRMIRNAVTKEIQEARARTQKAQRQRADVLAQMVEKVKQLEARVAFLERQSRKKAEATI